MKRLLSLFHLVLVSSLLASFNTQATVFTNNTAIGALDATYDGADIVISNCIVTMDGAHSFASLQVAAGGTLTHSFWPNGFIVGLNIVNNEPHVLNGTNPTTLLNTNIFTTLLVTDAGHTTTYTNGVDYSQTNLPDGSTQIQRTDTSTIPDGATVLVGYNWNNYITAGLSLTVTGDVVVATGSQILADGIGYGPAAGTGRGYSAYGVIPDGSGAGYGGYGGMSSSNAVGGNCYGLLYQPTSLGSGGGNSYAGNGGNGGGSIQITAGGSVTVDGLISANGADATNSRAGGGSGGSIWIIAGDISGSGSLSANGGAGEPIHGGGGGGGRISLQCGTNIFSGSATAYGGTGWQTGGAGTIFTQTNGQTGLLVMDNGGRVGTNSLVALSNPADVVIRRGAEVIPLGSFHVGSLTIESNGTLTGLPAVSLSVVASDNLSIQPGGNLSVNALGNLPGTGSGAGHPFAENGVYVCSGGGHGGYGAMASNTNATGGSTYGSQTAPTSFGSGGGNYAASVGGAGGGALQLTVSGNLQVDGILSADGGDGSGTGGGGGSGGNLNINCAALSGTGSITANGGNGVDSIGGGGGGGRIAVTANSNLFGGTLLAAGGGGANYGGAGTIFTDSGGSTQPRETQLILDNAGHSGTNTPLATASSTSLIIQNGAKGTATTSVTFHSLLVKSNAWLTQFGSGAILTISGDAIILAGGGFLADGGSSGLPGGYGYGGSTSYLPYACGGGGHGGTGGNSISNAAAGGSGGFDSVSGPAYHYPSGGGGNYLPDSIGGGGGGYLRMIVSGTLQLDGLMTANGGNGSGLGGGGGAGGGIYLTTGTFAGSGEITVNGGDGANVYGGGGGGGMIAIYFNTNTFSGSLAAYGGSGANDGGAGTIYLKTNSAPQALLIVDNGGHSGTTPGYQNPTTSDLILRNGGLYSLAYGNINFGNLLIGSNSWLVVSNPQPSSIIISAVNVTVLAGGGISADSAGFNANTGNGSGTSAGATIPYFACSGAGHGGHGAAPLSNSIYAGGNYYDNASSPTIPGSGGGSYQIYSTGGKGGGTIRMNLSGTLQLDGTLSANGGNGSGAGGGGGSGGTLNLNCITLSGSGSINANGGYGANGVGGGGAGGMIYANCTSNLFSGTISAYGGGGANWAGAGTIFLRTNTTQQTLLIVDNGGHRGTNTPLVLANNFIIRNGATAFQTSPQSITSLFISSNAWLVGKLVPGNGMVNLTVTGDANLQAGGGILADATGSAQNVGTGHGSYHSSPPYYVGSGAGHGGYGGFGGVDGETYVTGGGITFDSTTAPSIIGSGGGGYSPYSIGGSGGGYVRLMVNGTLQLDGSISANGGNGSGTGGGGGSGGSIYLAPGTFSGSGSITANGGNGANNYGGGGGGGRIAILLNSQRYLSNSFTGPVSAYGGGGANYGGAGTIYYGAYYTNKYAQLMLDNADHAGAFTSFDFINTDVTIQHEAVGLLPIAGSWSAHDILLRTNGTLAAPVSSSPRTLSANNLTIDSGGALSLNSDGYGSQAGPGSGFYSPTLRGGAGHGGYGGGNLPPYGRAYDSILTPTQAGSGGTSYNSGPPYGYGGYGGGALSLNVSGTLNVNGHLSADGGDGDNNCGGGSGGSLYLTFINQLTGNGVISANGGSGSGAAGGGGGGRIALVCNSNNFTGQLTAFGGNGLYPGGAGTIYSRIGSLQTLLVDNGGISGTNTPLADSFSLPGAPFDLNISGAAIVVPLTPLPLVSNLNLAAGSTLTMPLPQSRLVIAVQHDANLAGTVTVDSLGYAQNDGPGTGTSINQKGSGGGYGGLGGASSSGATGGTTYGSASQPVDFGSGGGLGLNNLAGGAQGGGALRISVGGTLNVDGTLTANGDSGWQDDSGGGSGGSIWITANTLTGPGTISASGGDGEPAGGGGGGGGRIAIYALTNLFAGSTNLGGGNGFQPGRPGTYFYSDAPLEFQIVSHSPNDAVTNTVSFVDLSFNEAVNPASVSTSDFTLTTPSGVLDASSLSTSVIDAATVRVSFPVQNLLGNYSIQSATTLTNIFGSPLAAGYTGNFSITLPTIAGTVHDTNGAPVAGVLMQPDGGLIGATTDADGNYAIGVPPGWNGTMTPSLGSFLFAPAALMYTNVTGSLSNQDYLMVTTIAPGLTAGLGGTNLLINWTGLAGVTYQTWWSTNLVDWLPLGDPLVGTNGPMQIQLPLDTDPAAFFRLRAAQ